MPSHRKLHKRIFSNVSFLTLGRVVNAICSFGYIAFAIRALGLRDFGILILIHSLATTASTLSRLQSWQTLIHYGDAPFKSKEFKRLAHVVGFCIRLDLMSAFVALLIGIVSVTLYCLFAGWSVQERALAYAYMLVSPLMYTGWAQGVLRLTGHFKLVPVSDTATALFRTCGAALGLLGHYALPFFVAVWAGTIILDYTLFVTFALLILLKRAHVRLNWQCVLGDWRWRTEGIWSFTRATSLNQTLSLVSNSVSTLVVGSVLGPAEAAIFRVCRQIADGIVTPAQLLSPVLYPELTRLRAEGNLRALARVTWRIFAILSLFSMLLLGISTLIGGKIFSFMLHMHFTGSTHYISVMMVSAAFGLMIVPLEPMLIVMGHVSRLVNARVIALVIYFPTLYFLTRAYALTGACYTAAGSGLIILLYWVWSAYQCSKQANAMHISDSVKNA